MLEKITENVEIHQTLPDTPNLTSEELKKEWDKGNKIIKEKFNKLIDSLNDAELLELKEKIEGTTLYENVNGTNETITLSESVENYRKIGIVYKDTRLGIENYVEIIEAHGKKVNLLSLQSLSYYYLTASLVSIQGNTITWELNDRIRISDGQNPADFWHVITKVVGYK